MKMVPGTLLSAADQRHVLAAYVNRYTCTHKPEWACQPRPNGQPYLPQFCDDADWLAHTEFVVTKSGRLDMRTRYCHSSPTWPQGTGGAAPGYCWSDSGGRVSGPKQPKQTR